MLLNICNNLQSKISFWRQRAYVMETGDRPYGRYFVIINEAAYNCRYDIYFSHNDLKTTYDLLNDPECIPGISNRQHDVIYILINNG